MLRGTMQGASRFELHVTPSVCVIAPQIAIELHASDKPIQTRSCEEE